MPPLQIETAVVQHALAPLNPHKGQGFDSLHPAVLKAIAPLVAQPVTDLFDISLVSAEIRDDWRSAIVCPIYKEVDAEDPRKYCPVNFTSIVCKPTDMALKGAIPNHLKQRATLFAAQHGFIPHRSSLLNLVPEERMTWLMDSGEGVDLVYLDFAKAFDSVNHRMLYDTMLAYGVHRSIADWTRSFLSNRTFQVRV